MKRRANAYVIAVLVVSATALGGPALVRAASGGGGLGGSGGGSGKSGPSSSRNGTVQRADVRVTANGNGISFSTRASALLHRAATFSGNVGSSFAGETVEIERKGRETGGQWANTAHGIASSGGSFTAVWPTNHIGQFAIRAVIVSHRSSRAASASPSLRITIYRPAIATMYGPGFWGSRTACGEILRRSMIGTANRTLPCGTPVAIYYNGKMMVVPVIDRGPYANHADWDLTLATDKAMGIPGTATIGAVSVSRH